MKTHNSPHGLALYTRPCAEKTVHRRLEESGHTSNLPLKKTERQWSDRVKIVELPLIPSYVFVQCTNRHRPDIVRINGVVNFVFECGKPAIIHDEEIERM